MPYSRARRRSLWRRSSCARVVSHHSNSDGISPSLTLMSPSNFHKTHAFLRVTNTCHCLVSDDDLHQHTTYRISLSLLLSYQTYPKAARLASLLPQSPLHTPPASAAPLPRKLPTMCLVPRRPPEKETLVWRLLAFVPFSGIIYVSNDHWPTELRLCYSRRPST